jgi:hypothetical protein
LVTHRQLVAEGPPAAHATGPGFLSWSWPLLWIVLIPLVTVPATWWLLGRLVDGRACVDLGPTGPASWTWSSSCPVAFALATLAPGLLNLVPALGLRSPQPRARTAATVATLLGAMRLLVPALLLLSSGPQVRVVWGFGPPVLHLFGPIPGNDPAMAVSPILWVVSVIALVWLGRRRPGVSYAC